MPDRPPLPGQVKADTVVRELPQFGLGPGPSPCRALGHTEPAQQVGPASPGPPCAPGVLSLEARSHQQPPCCPQAAQCRPWLLAQSGAHQRALSVGRGCMPGSQTSPRRHKQEHAAAKWRGVPVSASAPLLLATAPQFSFGEPCPPSSEYVDRVRPIPSNLWLVACDETWPIRACSPAQ